MHSKFIRLTLVCGCFPLLLIHSAIAQINPPPPPPDETPSPSPSPTVPLITPPPVAPVITPTVPPAPTIPPVSPPPVATPTIPPPRPSPSAPPPHEDPTPPPTPTAPPVTPPPVVTPTVPPAPTIPPAPTVPPLSSPPPISPLRSLEQAHPQRATAVIRYGQGGSLAPKNDYGRFQKVALLPNQVITVVLSLGLTEVGKPADVQILDGGAISSNAPNPKEVVPPTPTPRPTIGADGSTAPSETVSPSPPPTISPTPPRDLDDRIGTGQILTVSQAGELLFRFVPGNDIGLHRVSVIVGGNQYFFHFWRQDPNAPNNNPSMLRAY